MSDSVTLITGSSKGIGRHLAAHYLQLGQRVIGCSRRESDLKDPNYKHFQVDVSDEEQVGNLFSSIRRDFGRLDHVINNAGIASMNHSLLTPVPTLKKILDTNVVGTFLISRESAKIMKRNKFGRIVNFTTVAVPLKLEGESAYVASKAAIESLTHVLAREFAAMGITVNAVGPTPIKTDLIRGISPEKIDALIAKQALKTLGKFEDITNVVDFFLRTESRLVTGQVVYLGGV